mmetsp:Transcript_53046/g.169879  ORF Transcript_53046/g.169879 Transcript_53046/m.169879 type:complete len:400 (-) Transcript_53046:66-1265(-)
MVQREVRGRRRRLHQGPAGAPWHQAVVCARALVRLYAGRAKHGDLVRHAEARLGRRARRPEVGATDRGDGEPTGDCLDGRQGKVEGGDWRYGRGAANQRGASQFVIGRGAPAGGRHVRGAASHRSASQFVSGRIAPAGVVHDLRQWPAAPGAGSRRRPWVARSVAMGEWGAAMGRSAQRVPAVCWAAEVRIHAACRNALCCSGKGGAVHDGWHVLLAGQRAAQRGRLLRLLARVRVDHEAVLPLQHPPVLGLVGLGLGKAELVVHGRIDALHWGRRAPRRRGPGPRQLHGVPGVQQLLRGLADHAGRLRGAALRAGARAGRPGPRGRGRGPLADAEDGRDLGQGGEGLQAGPVHPGQGAGGRARGHGLACCLRRRGRAERGLLRQAQASIVEGRAHLGC